MTTIKEITAAAAELSKYDFGHPTDAIFRIEKCAREAYGQPKLETALSDALNQVALDSVTSVAARQFACKMLWIIGPAHATPVFEMLLASPDIHLVEAACYAIGSAPGADSVLVKALGPAQGGAQVAIVNLLGSRRVAAAVAPLAKVAATGGDANAEAAIASLGKIGTREAVAALKQLKAASARRRFAVSAALLEASQVLRAHGESAAALQATEHLSSQDKAVVRGAEDLRRSCAKDAMEGFVPLYNGRNLDEWEIDTPGLWQVRNGVIIGRSPGLKYSDYLRTKKSYENFVLRAKIRMIDGDGNSGIQFRSKPAAIPHELERYQADAGEQYWGTLYDESRRKTLAGPDDAFRERFDPTIWHRYVVSAKGNHIRLELDGVETVNYEEPDASVARRGILALQIHAWPHPVEVWFRDLMIQVL